jgi:hypothetical protein
MQGSLIADFGPLLGAPCAISIAGNGDPLPSYEMYAFTGVSVNYCVGEDTQTITASSENSITGKSSGLAACGTCYLNFETVAVTAGGTAASAAIGFNPIKLFIYVFHTVQQYLDNISDPVNVPKKYTVNVAAVNDAVKRYGNIPDNCVKMLSEGLNCFDTECNARIAKYFEDTYGGKITEMNTEVADDLESDETTVAMKSSLCDGTIRMNYSCEDNQKDLDVFGAPEASTPSCQEAIDGKQGTT